MSSTTATTKRCCEKCDTSRTYRQFMKNHTNKFIRSAPRKEEDTCVICQLPYGSENLSLRMLDHCLVVTNLSGCTHIFGAACIKWLSCDSDAALCVARSVEQNGGMKRTQLPPTLTTTPNTQYPNSLPDNGKQTTVQLDTSCTGSKNTMTSTHHLKV